MSELERIRADAIAALKNGDRQLASQLRMIQDAVQQDEKLGKGDAIAVLQRERKRRLEAARSFSDAGRTEQAASEQAEADLIAGYLPAQLTDGELADLVAGAIRETGATEQRDMGRVMAALKEPTAGRADGGRVSALVREQLGA